MTQKNDKAVKMIPSDPQDYFSHNNEENVEAESLENLRKLISDEKSLNCPMNSAFLLRFLRARKFEVNSSFQLIQKYFQVKINYPELFIYIRPSELLHVFQDNIYTILSQRDQHGRIVVIYKPGRWNPDHCTLNELGRVLLFGLELAIREEETQINGIVVIVDWKNFGFRQLKHQHPLYAKKLIYAFQECFPALFKAIHVVRQQFLFEIVFAMTKPFLSEQIKKSIHVHGENLDSLHKHINREILPEEFGGLQPPMDNSQVVQQLLALDDEFDEMSKYGYNETKVRTKEDGE